MDYTINFKDGKTTEVDDAACFGDMCDGMPYNYDEDEYSPCSNESVSCVFDVTSATYTGNKDVMFFHKIMFERHHELLPQFFANCTWTFNSSGVLQSFEAPMGENSIQTTMFALRSVRNITGSSNLSRMFVTMYEKTGDLNFSFLASLSFYISSGFQGSKVWMFNDNDSGVLDMQFMRVDDFKHLLNGGIGYDFQGRWCDSSEGYGSYGRYHKGIAPVFSRTKKAADLFSNSLMEKLPEESGILLSEIAVSELEIEEAINNIIKALR